MNAIQNDTPSTTPLTAAQYQRVQRLGAAYGHLYADVMCDGLHADREECHQHDGTVSPADIAAAVARLNNLGPGGIAWPLVEGEVVVHTTGSGRLNWAVTPEGLVHLQVNRPEGQALWAYVMPEDALYVGSYDEVPFHTRHVHALRFAILAALGLVRHYNDEVSLGEEPEAVRAALAPLYAAALPSGSARAAAPRTGRWRRCSTRAAPAAGTRWMSR